MQNIVATRIFQVRITRRCYVELKKDDDVRSGQVPIEKLLSRFISFLKLVSKITIFNLEDIEQILTTKYLSNYTLNFSLS